MEKLASFVFENKEKLDDDFYVKMMNLLKEEKQKQKDLYEITIFKPFIFVEDEDFEFRISYDRYKYTIKLTDNQLEKIQETNEIHYDLLRDKLSCYTELSGNNIRLQKLNYEDDKVDVDLQENHFLNENYPVLNIKKVE